MYYFYPHQHSKLRKQQFSNIGKHKALKCGIEKSPSWSQPTFFILIRANEWIWIGGVLTSSWLDQLSFLAQLEAPHKHVYSNLLFRQHTQYKDSAGCYHPRAVGSSQFHCELERRRVPGIGFTIVILQMSQWTPCHWFLSAKSQSCISHTLSSLHLHPAADRDRRKATKPCSLVFLEIYNY